ncbi:MAG: recO [Chlamydiia bacterium]|nr:recO [Chlamydiia bacterium]
MHRRGLEPPTTWFEARYSIRLSYRCKMKYNRQYYIIRLYFKGSMKSIEGIILKARSFGEASHILTLFSKECGLIQLVTNNHYKKFLRSYSPLLKVEADVIPSDKELWKCKELIITASYQACRLNLEKLKIAIFILHKIHRILPYRQPIESLYVIIDEHLNALNEHPKPYAAGASLLLKLYHHEGMLQEHLYPNVEKLLKADLRELEDIDCSLELLREIAKGGT